MQLRIRPFFLAAVGILTLSTSITLLSPAGVSAQPTKEPNRATWVKVIWYPSNNPKEGKHCNQIMASEDIDDEPLQEKLRALAQSSCAALGENRCPRGEASITLTSSGSCPDKL